MPLLVAPSPIDGASGIIPPPVSQEVVQYYCEHEWARHLSDIMVQRSSWAYYLDDHHAQSRTVAGWMADCLKWSPDRIVEETTAYAAMVETLESFSPES